MSLGKWELLAGMWLTNTRAFSIATETDAQRLKKKKIKYQGPNNTENDIKASSNRHLRLKALTLSV